MHSCGAYVWVAHVCMLSVNVVHACVFAHMCERMCLHIISVYRGTWCACVCVCSACTDLCSVAHMDACERFSMPGHTASPLRKLFRLLFPAVHVPLPLEDPGESAEFWRAAVATDRFRGHERKGSGGPLTAWEVL